MNQYYIQGKRPKTDADTDGKNHWQTVGRATELDDGTFLLRINAIPLNWDGELKMKFDDGNTNRGRTK